MMDNIYIKNITPANVTAIIDQCTANRAVQNMLLSRDDLCDTHSKYLVSEKYIAQRELAALSVGSPNETRALFLNGSGEQSAIATRMKFFDKTAIEAFKELYKVIDKAPDGLVHVSCSGYKSPSVAQQYFSARGWLNSTITHSYHMGCYGAFPGLRTAIGKARSGTTLYGEESCTIDVVHTELLSIHGNYDNTDPENLTIMSLFADGYCKYSVSNIEPNSETCYRVIGMHENLIPASLEEMTWEIGNSCFEMHLGLLVPAYIDKYVKGFVEELLKNAHLPSEDLSSYIFAVHPGGPKILDLVRERLNITHSSMKHSYNVLYKNGNMSSATIPHIWNSILEDDSIIPGQKVISMAFGPGLTVTGAVFEKV